jgi:hypothetical protein
VLSSTQFVASKGQSHSQTATLDRTQKAETASGSRVSNLALRLGEPSTGRDGIQSTMDALEDAFSRFTVFGAGQRGASVSSAMLTYDVSDEIPTTVRLSSGHSAHRSRHGLQKS